MSTHTGEQTGQLPEIEKPGMTRRDFLKLAATLGGLGVIAGVAPKVIKAFIGTHPGSRQELAGGPLDSPPTDTPSPEATPTPEETPNPLQEMTPQEIAQLKEAPFYFTEEALTPYERFGFKEIDGYNAQVGIQEDGIEKVLAMEVIGVNEEMTWMRVAESVDPGVLGSYEYNVAFEDGFLDEYINNEEIGLLAMLVENLRNDDSLDSLHLESVAQLRQMIADGEEISFINMVRPREGQAGWESSVVNAWEKTAPADLTKPMEVALGFDKETVESWPEEVQAEMMYSTVGWLDAAGNLVYAGNHVKVAPDGHLQFYLYLSDYKERFELWEENNIGLSSLKRTLAGFISGRLFGQAILLSQYPDIKAFVDHSIDNAEYREYYLELFDKGLLDVQSTPVE